MMAETLTCRYCQRKRLARLIDEGTGWFWRRSSPLLAQVWAFWIWLPPSPAQVSASFGAGHQPSWRKCGFRVGTCARKWALAHSGGAGHTPFSTPAPKLAHTPAKTWVHLRQSLDIPAPRQDTPEPRHGRLTPAHGNIAPAHGNIRVRNSAESPSVPRGGRK